MFAIYKCNKCGAKRVWGFGDQPAVAYLQCAKEGEFTQHHFDGFSSRRIGCLDSEKDVYGHRVAATQ